MTNERTPRDIIDDFREIVKPRIAKMLFDANYEGLGKSDKAEFETEFEVILTLADMALKRPIVRPQESKTGHWIEHPEIETSTPEYLMFYECSECEDKQCFYKTDIHKKRFCNNCGARMESSDKG